MPRRCETVTGIKPWLIQAREQFGDNAEFLCQTGGVVSTITDIADRVGADLVIVGRTRPGTIGLGVPGPHLEDRSCDESPHLKCLVDLSISTWSLGGQSIVVVSLTERIRSSFKSPNPRNNGATLCGPSSCARTRRLEQTPNRGRPLLCKDIVVLVVALFGSSSSLRNLVGDAV
jgi:hypothetical protein